MTHGSTARNQANNLATGGSSQEQGAYNAFASRNDAQTGVDQQHANDLYGSISSGYQSLLNPDGTVTSNIEGRTPFGQGGYNAGGGGGGGIGVGGPGIYSEASDPRFGQATSGYNSFMNSLGGFDPTQAGNINTAIADFQDISRTGGVSDRNIQGIEGDGVFREFAQTGGYNDNDLANIRSRGTSVIPAMFGQIRQQSDQARSIQGGYGPGASALQGRLARQQASAVSDAALNTELGIKDKVNTGRQWGANSLSAADLALSQEQSYNRLAADTGSSQAALGLGTAEQQGRMFGTQGLAQMAEAARADATQRAGIGASSSAANASIQAALEMSAQKNALEQRLASYGGLQSLYSSTPGAYNSDMGFNLSNRAIDSTIQGGWANTLYGNNKGPDWGKWASLIGAGAATAFTGGAAAPLLATAATQFGNEEDPRRFD